MNTADKFVRDLRDAIDSSTAKLREDLGIPQPQQAAPDTKTPAAVPDTSPDQSPGNGGNIYITGGPAGSPPLIIDGGQGGVTITGGPGGSLVIQAPAASPVDVPGASKEAIALAVLADHPDWSDDKIAKAAGCHRSTLYTFGKFMAAKEILKKGKAAIAHGSKFPDENVDAWYDSLGDRDGQYRRPRHKAKE